MLPRVGLPHPARTAHGLDLKYNLAVQVSLRSCRPGYAEVPHASVSLTIHLAQEVEESNSLGRLCRDDRLPSRLSAIDRWDLPVA